MPDAQSSPTPKRNAVAILPARGGSKRIPFKNGRDFLGKPMIVWAIDAALASGVFDRVVVTTDSADLAKIALDAGAQTPFMRAPELSDDHTGTTDVIRDAVSRLALAPDTSVCCLYPTGVFTRPEDLRHGHELLQSPETDWVFTVGEYPAPIQRAYKQDNGRLIPFSPEDMPKRSQDLTPAYFDAGQFYFAHARTWLDPAARVWDGARPIVLPRDACVDIDTPEDWAMAEHLMTVRNAALSHPPSAT